jgi:aminobenzoyl-glutamate transport protein
MSGFIVLIFMVSQTLAVLAYSNLGTWMAVTLAGAAEHVGLTGFPLLLLLVLISSTLNLVITSGSGLWSLEATVMVPAFILTGRKGTPGVWLRCVPSGYFFSLSSGAHTINRL